SPPREREPGPRARTKRSRLPFSPGSRVSLCSPGTRDSRPSPRAGSRALDRGRGLAEQDRTLFRRADAAHIGIDRLRLPVGALDGRPRADRLEPALEMREILELLALAFVRHDPGIDRHVRDRIVARDE